jgi:cobaltochelatase CobN
VYRNINQLTIRIRALAWLLAWARSSASGLYVDGLAEKIIMLDRAARMAAAAGDNALSRQNRETVKTLMATNMSAEQATKYAGARVFSTAPGNYGFGLSNMVEQSRDVDEHRTIADLYLAKMNYVYTEKTWGSTVPKLLQNQLKGNQVVLHSVASNLYGAVDNDCLSVDGWPAHRL